MSMAYQLLSKSKRRRIAQAKRAEEQRWKALNGPVTVRPPPSKAPTEYAEPKPNVKA